MKGPRARRYGEAPHPPICKGPAPADMEGLRFRRYVRASHPPILNTAPDTELPCISRRQPGAAWRWAYSIFSREVTPLNSGQWSVTWRQQNVSHPSFRNCLNTFLKIFYKRVRLEFRNFRIALLCVPDIWADPRYLSKLTFTQHMHVQENPLSLGKEWSKSKIKCSFAD